MSESTSREAKETALMGLTFLENIINQNADDANISIRTFTQEELINQLTAAAASVVMLTAQKQNITAVELIKEIRTLLQSTVTE